MLHWPFRSRRRIGDTQAAIALFAAAWSDVDREQLGLAYLDAELRLLRLSVVFGSRSDGVELPLRALVRDALTLDAHGLLLAHTHVHAAAEPSGADRVATRRLVDVAHPLGIRVLDHLVFAGEDVASFRALGLL